MSISSIGSDASQVWQHQRESRTQKAGSTDGTGAGQKPSRGSFPSLPPDADSSLDGTGTSTGTSGNNSISGSASKLIADVKSLLISLQAGNTPTGAAPGASSAATATGTGAASGDGTASAASSGTAGSSPTGSLSQDQLTGLSSVLNDLGKVHGGGHHHHPHGAPPSGSQSADAGGTGAAAAPSASGASASQPASGSTASDLLAQLGKALSAYGTGQASATSQPGTVIAA
jgi:hypothetical protein